MRRPCAGPSGPSQRCSVPRRRWLQTWPCPGSQAPTRRAPVGAAPGRPPRACLRPGCPWPW
eukprot:5729812-Lingulodinium_polyedra.AAC.1